MHKARSVLRGRMRGGRRSHFLISSCNLWCSGRRVNPCLCWGRADFSLSASSSSARVTQHPRCVAGGTEGVRRHSQVTQHGFTQPAPATRSHPPRDPPRPTSPQAFTPQGLAPHLARARPPSWSRNHFAHVEQFIVSRRGAPLQVLSGCARCTALLSSHLPSGVRDSLTFLQTFPVNISVR